MISSSIYEENEFWKFKFFRINELVASEWCNDQKHDSKCTWWHHTNWLINCSIITRRKWIQRRCHSNWWATIISLIKKYSYRPLLFRWLGIINCRLTKVLWTTCFCNRWWESRIRIIVTRMWCVTQRSGSRDQTIDDSSYLHVYFVLQEKNQKFFTVQFRWCLTYLHLFQLLNGSTEIDTNNNVQ